MQDPLAELATVVDDVVEAVARTAPPVGTAALDRSVEVTSAVLEVAQTLGAEFYGLLDPATSN